MARLDFPRTNRLLKKSDFQFVFSKPNKIARKYLLVLYRRNHLGLARLGTIIGKNLVKRSTTRNSIRRIVRESFRQHQDRMKGLDLIVIMRSEWSPQDKITLRKDIDFLWQRIAGSEVVSSR